MTATDGKRRQMDCFDSEGIVALAKLKELLSAALTNKINDRAMFMKGIDYSYYYEESVG